MESKQGKFSDTDKVEDYREYINNVESYYREEIKGLAEDRDSLRNKNLKLRRMLWEALNS